MSRGGYDYVTELGIRKRATRSCQPAPGWQIAAEIPGVALSDS